jgi:hypothetical protein
LQPACPSCRTKCVDLLVLKNSPDVIAAKTASIRDVVLLESGWLGQPNFQKITVDDLACMFSQYDRQFFAGWLTQAVQAECSKPLKLRLSAAMTSAGGKTTKYHHRRLGCTSKYYEIAIASRLLSMTFGQVQRPVFVCGLACRDRLDALQRIMEHEIIHLAEMLAWDESSCSGIRFRTLARRIFGHKDIRHELVSPREHAAVGHGLHVGGMVEFCARGRRLVGRINRINRRATVLVEDRRGLPYSDGGVYSKFYIPIDRLTPRKDNG